MTTDILKLVYFAYLHFMSYNTIIWRSQKKKKLFTI